MKTTIRRGTKIVWLASGAATWLAIHFGQPSQIQLVPAMIMLVAGVAAISLGEEF